MLMRKHRLYLLDSAVLILTIARQEDAFRTRRVLRAPRIRLTRRIAENSASNRALNAFPTQTN